MPIVKITVSFGVEHAGSRVRLYGSLADGAKASLPFVALNPEKNSLTDSSFTLVGESFLDENGKVTFQWEEAEHGEAVYQAAVEESDGWRLSNPLSQDSTVAQALTYILSPTFDTVDANITSTYEFTLTVVTSDGGDVESEASEDVSIDTAFNLTNGVDFDFTDPTTIDVPAGTPNGSTFAVQVEILGNGVSGTLTLSTEAGDTGTLEFEVGVSS